MALSLKKHPMPVQDAKVRAHNFDEVALGYDEETAVAEAERCLHCKVPQCRKGCPVSINIPEFIAKIKERDYDGAVAKIKESNSLPAVCGRVCPQENQCEKFCILGKKGESVGIGRLERFVADRALEKDEKVEKPDVAADAQSVAVIGSGPSGLACAGDLAKKGYKVTIFEALHKAGGVLSYGIPEFRLPKDRVVQKEIDNIKALGVKIELDSVAGRLYTVDELMNEEGFDAVSIVYRRSAAELPARAEEVEHAKEEGIDFQLLTNPVAIEDNGEGWVKSMRCIRMELGEPDASGRRRPVPIEGSEFDIDVDTVIVAIGTGPNPIIAHTTPGLETTKRGNIAADEETGATSKEGVFAGGDIVTGAATVILAMGAGRKAAAAIDEYLQKKKAQA